MFFDFPALAKSWFRQQGPRNSEQAGCFLHGVFDLTSVANNPHMFPMYVSICPSVLSVLAVRSPAAMLIAVIVLRLRRLAALPNRFGEVSSECTCDLWTVSWRTLPMMALSAAAAYSHSKASLFSPRSDSTDAAELEVLPSENQQVTKVPRWHRDVSALTSMRLKQRPLELLASVFLV